MKGLDEDQIIRIVRSEIGDKGGFVPDDVEVFKQGGIRMAMAVDTMTQGTDMPRGMWMDEVARKSVAACVSDFAAKGVRPEFGSVSLTVPADMSAGQIRRMARGFKAASSEFGVRILGGDTGGGAELVISVWLCGAAAHGIVSRGGAAAGDIIFATGAFGNTAAGLHLMLSSGGRRRPRLGSADRRYVDAFCSPSPRLEFGIRIGRHITSAMDSSDGLAATLNEMSRQSGRRFVVSRLPYDTSLEGFASRHNVSATDLVLFGGEEYEIVFTAPRGSAARICRIAAGCGVELTRVGTVGRESKGGGDVVMESGGVTKAVKDRGWSHLRGES